MEAWIYLIAALLWTLASLALIWRITRLKNEEDFPHTKDEDGRKF